MYNRLLLECKRVVVVAHSQSNFYANMAAGGIDPNLADSFRIVSVANPTSFVEGEGPHTTIEEDLVIALVPGSMPANVNNYDPDEIYSPWMGHYFVENYLSPDHLAEFKIVTDIINEITDVMDNDNTDYCGWPASFGGDFRIFREPYDLLPSSVGLTSNIWDTLVWPAVLADSLIVEYRLGRSGAWTRLPQASLHSGLASYEPYSSSGGPVAAPWLFVNDQFSVGNEIIDLTIEVQPDDVLLEILKGIQQYRLIVNDKVIDQFTVDYHMAPWSTVRTSGPIIDSLPASSNPIQLIQ